MAQVINTNTMSLNAQRNLGTSGANLATTIQRLSSGMRINSAKDDAAGLAISERFTTQIRGANQAARNANDGISLAQTAEGALGEIGNNLQRVRELAVQSRSATNSDSDRQALNAEVQLLKQEIQRVAEQTNFNGTNLLDGTFTNQAFQIGANQGQTINISQVTNANISKLGSWTSATKDASSTGVVANGGAKDAKPTEATQTAAFTTVTAGTAYKLSVNGISIIDQAAGGANPVDAAAIDTALKDTTLTKKLADAGITFTGTAAGDDLAFTKADGTKITIAETAAGFGTGFAKTHATGTEAVAASFGKTSFTIAGTVDGKLGSAVTIDLEAAKTAGDRATQLVNAVNAKTHETGVSAALVEGKVQLTGKEGDFTIASADSDALLEATGLTTGTTANYSAGGAKTGFADLDISSKGGADNAILAMDAALNSINSARADLGAIQNRFTSVVANLNTSSENMSAARSRIRDVDYASETAELTRNQILQQAGTAMLAQANQSSQNVLSLLR
ncbi:flagellin [Stenotrophomonas maltophilia]|uniref:Flagellin n=1 Tax=Stenotrophomonas riyadhensis TaxID=2859893 RepID=A0ABT2XBD7_9GAMM|nr:flagellin [Stenotrophomonas sp. CFS3442]MBH1619637.1 flagellin [Stenotrophomonas maltophilia]MCV0323253.1 flagellin [Stenotrophomonas sp. CFS3442]HEL4245345.1 flagellin [Stenotrophomonas maltophilia]